MALQPKETMAVYNYRLGDADNHEGDSDNSSETSHVSTVYSSHREIFPEEIPGPQEEEDWTGGVEAFVWVHSPLPIRYIRYTSHPD